MGDTQRVYYKFLEDKGSFYWNEVVQTDNIKTDSGEICNKKSEAEPINVNSIARDCETDAYTVELILAEIIAQLKYQIKTGTNLKLSLKVGRLTSKNSKVQWHSL